MGLCGFTRLRQRGREKQGQWLTHQKEGPHGGDLVQLHKQTQGLLVVAAIFFIYAELVLLQDKDRGCGRQVMAGRQTL